MTRQLAALAGALATVILTATVVSGLSGPVSAAPEPSATGQVPIAVIIPGPSGSPSPSTPPPSGGGSGSGAGSGSGSGSGTPTPSSTPGAPTAPKPPASPTEDAHGLTLDKPTYAAHDWMLVTGSGYAPGEKVQFVLYPGAVVLGSHEADAGGTVTARIRVPDDTRPGSHVIEGTGWTSGYVANADFTVVAVAATAPWLWWVFVVLGVIVAGLVALAIYFRSSIRGWFAPGVPVGSVS